MKVIKITDNGRTVTHYSSPLQADYIFCCLDSIGDPDCDISPPEIISGEITCPDCIRLIKHAWKVNLKDLKE